MEHPQRFSTRKSAKIMVPQWFHFGFISWLPSRSLVSLSSLLVSPWILCPLSRCLVSLVSPLCFFAWMLCCFPFRRCYVRRPDAVLWCIGSTGVGQHPVALAVEPNGSLDLLAAHGHLVDHRAGGSLQQACWEWR